VGIGLYGLYPSDACRSVIDLRPAMRVVSHVAHVRRHPAGARPSYGRRRALEVDSNVATVPIGYADGVPRLLSDRGEVLIGGKRRPLAGTVTMDQIVVDCGDDRVEAGDEVVLIGRQGDGEISADEWAELTGTISYEIVCGIGPRLPRRFIE
jgi:alanine racemase